jgi:four helix bundle protein
MSNIETYKDLVVWQKSINLVKDVYLLTELFPLDEKFGLTSQIRRSVLSIPTNIAEGWGRMSRKNYIQFLRTSRGSLFELETQIIISKELKYCIDCENIDNLIIEISKMLNSMINKLEEKD